LWVPFKSDSACQPPPAGRTGVGRAGFNPLRQRLPAATVREHGGRGECPGGISNGVYTFPVKKVAP